ncbi:MAG: hypothetical protein WCY59_00005, partial [Anaerovoracaceae bacterium]
PMPFISMGARKVFCIFISRQSFAAEAISFLYKLNIEAGGAPLKSLIVAPCYKDTNLCNKTTKQPR